MGIRQARVTWSDMIGRVSATHACPQRRTARSGRSASTLHSMTRNRTVLRRVATALLVAGLVTARMASAQVTLNFVNADIDQVAKAIGAATGKTIIVDPRVKGQLNLVSENPVPEDQALKTLQSALRMQGFALVQDHGVLKVVPEADAKLQGVPTYVGGLADVVRSPRYATSVGLLLEGREQFLRGQAARAQVSGIGGVAERMRQWFKANF